MAGPIFGWAIIGATKVKKKCDWAKFLAGPSFDLFPSTSFVTRRLGTKLRRRLITASNRLITATNCLITALIRSCKATLRFQLHLFYQITMERKKNVSNLTSKMFYFSYLIKGEKCVPLSSFDNLTIKSNLLQVPIMRVFGVVLFALLFK